MRKNYQKPDMDVYAYSMEQVICQTSRVTSVTNSVGIGYGGGGNGTASEGGAARVGRRSIWDGMDE